MTDTARLVKGLELIAEGFTQVALAIESPQVPSAVSGGAQTPPPARAETAPAPPDLPPSFDELPPEWAEPADPIPAVLAATGGEEVTPSKVMWGDGGVCPDHTRPWKAVPAGVSSRTGKSYRAFWACPENFCKQRPDAEWAKKNSATKAAA